MKNAELADGAKDIQECIEHVRKTTAPGSLMMTIASRAEQAVRELLKSVMGPKNQSGPYAYPPDTVFIQGSSLTVGDVRWLLGLCKGNLLVQDALIVVLANPIGTLNPAPTAACILRSDKVRARDEAYVREHLQASFNWFPAAHLSTPLAHVFPEAWLIRAEAPRV